MHRMRATYVTKTRLTHSGTGFSFMLYKLSTKTVATITSVVMAIVLVR